MTDVSKMITIALQLGFFLTPVVYPAPETFPYSLLATWNPVSPYLLSSRELLVNGTTSGHLAPLVIVTVCLVGGTLLSWLVYRVSMPIIIERISA
jgi:lipopolysaccharide transport system permease protein